MGKQDKRQALTLAEKMGISLICGLAAGALLLFLRESLMGSGKEAVWNTVNSLFFQDITAQGAEKALGIFYLIASCSSVPSSSSSYPWYLPPLLWRLDRFQTPERWGAFPPKP